MSYNGLAECCTGFRSTDFSSLRRANSFIHNFIRQLTDRQVVKDELAVLQQRTTVIKTAETRITYDTSLANVTTHLSQLVLHELGKIRKIGFYNVLW